MKDCRLCNIKKTLKEFPRRSSSKDGYRNECKLCSKALHQRNYQSKRKQKLIQAAEYRSTHKEEISIRDRRYRENNRKVIKGKKSKYYQSNKNKHKQRNYNYRQTESGKAVVKACAHRRRALKKLSEGSFTHQEWIALIKKYPFCVCCKKNNVVLTVDHVVPLSKGGTNWIGNIQPLCRSCNSKKGVSIVDYRN